MAQRRIEDVALKAMKASEMRVKQRRKRVDAERKRILKALDADRTMEEKEQIKTDKEKKKDALAAKKEEFQALRMEHQKMVSVQNFGSISPIVMVMQLHTLVNGVER